MRKFILLSVNPKYRPAMLLAIAAVVFAPHMVFMHYCITHYPQNLPTWAGNTLAIWFAANFLILLFAVRKSGKFFRMQPTDSDKAQRALSSAQTRVTGLVVVWIGFFPYGAIQTLRGKYPLDRAIPAGGFLLFFIALFGWSLYRSRSKKA